MKYPAYPQYKDSGVAWLGEVPEDWTVKGLRYVCRLAYGDSLAAENREEGDIAVYGSNGQVGSHIISNTEAPVIVVGRKGSFGKINYSGQPVFAIDTTYYIDSNCTSNSLDWLKYALLVLRLDENSKDSAVPGLAREDAYASKLPVPPSLEQTAIADFLDRETGRIDTLVAKKRKLVALLKEKRSALISRTVTRGLPADAAREFGLTTGNSAVHEAPGAYGSGEASLACRGEKFFVPTEGNGIPERLKDSRVEWLGEIPTHWHQTQIKHIAQVRQGVTKGRDLAGKEIIELPYLRVANVQDGYLDLSEISTIPVMENEIKRFSLKKGDVLMNEGGDNDKLGRGTVWNDEIPICLHQNHVFSVRPFDIKLSAWIALWTQGAAAKSYFLLRGKQTTNLASISSTSVRELPIIIPPLYEQTAIAAYLDRETAKIDRLVAKVETAIARLLEYRSALITAAVTGKIDVREAL